MIERTLSHYRVIEKLGEGGMGEVYLAQDTKLGRKVALKVLPPSLADDPYRLRLFREEAHAVASLNHPNIVTLHSVEEADGLNFLVMELVEGQNLAECIPPQGRPLVEFFDLAIPLSDALCSAHEHGVIHRDLKPTNIMVTGKGVPKILDFGLAKLRPVEAAMKDSRQTTASLFDEDGVRGTLSYMSPEQVQGKAVDERSDVFSLGIVLYELATGRQPFARETAADVVSAILRDRPRPVDELRPTLPHHLGRIIRQCLEKRRERRLQSAKDLRNELLDLRDETMSTKVAAARPAGRALWPGVAGLLLLLLAATVIWRSRDRQEPAPRLRPDVQTLLEQGRLFELNGYTRYDLNEAEDRYRRALELDPADPVTQARLAALLARIQIQYPRSERAEEIRRLTTEALAKDADLVAAHVAMGELSLLADDAASAAQAARRAKQADLTDFLGYTLMGKALIRQGRVDEGLSELREAVIVAKSDLRARLTLAHELSKLGHTDEAGAEYERILEYEPNSLNALNNLAVIFGRSGRELEAISLLKRLLELRDDESAALNLGMSYLNLGRTEEAIEAFLAAHRMAPGKPIAPHSLGDAYEKLEDVETAASWYGAALERYDLVLEAGGPRAPSLGPRAVCAAKLGRFDEALENIRDALELAPNRYRLFNAAQVYALAEDREVAFHYVRRAIEAGYPRQEIQRDLCFRAFRDEPEFRDLFETAFTSVPDS